MRNNNFFLCGLVIAGLLSGCSKFNQDPMAGQPVVKENESDRPTGEKPKPGKNTDNIVIDTVDFYTFQEEVEGHFTISARMLTGYNTQIDILNMDDFTNSKFDASSGTFSWTPPLGVVSAGTMVQKDLRIRVIASKAGEPDEVRVETRPMYIHRALSMPEIISIQKPNSIREGEVGKIQVVVFDKAATPDAPDTYPTLIGHDPIDSYYSKSLAGLMSVGDPKSIGNNQYSFEIVVSLVGKEVTKGADSYSASLIAYSSLGVKSLDKSVSLDILTSFSDLRNTWWDNITVKLGDRLIYTFLIYDPKEELTLETPTFQGLPLGASVVCDEDGGNEARQLCTLDWTPTVDQKLGLINFNALVEVSNSDSYRDNKTEVKKIPLSMRVTKSTSLTSERGEKHQ